MLKILANKKFNILSLKMSKKRVCQDFYNYTLEQCLPIFIFVCDTLTELFKYGAFKYWQNSNVVK